MTLSELNNSQTFLATEPTNLAAKEATDSSSTVVEKGLKSVANIADEHVKKAFDIFDKLRNDNLVRQIVQMIVIDIILVVVFYLITFFLFNKQTRMGDNDYAPADNADDVQLNNVGAGQGIGNIQINEADLPAF